MLCYCDDMKNVTISVPDEVYRAARIRAAEEGSSISAIVTAYLRSLTGVRAEFSRLEAQERTIKREIRQFRAGDRPGRDEIHDRAVR